MWHFLWWFVVVPLATLWLLLGLWTFVAILKAVHSLAEESDPFEDTMEAIHHLPTRKDDGC